MVASVMMDVAMVMWVRVEAGMLNSFILQLFLFVETMQLLQQLSNEGLNTHTHTHTQVNLTVHTYTNCA